MNNDDVQMDPSQPEDRPLGPGGEYPGAPRWVKRFGIALIGLILLGIVTLVVLTVLGLHDPGGPRRHGPGGELDGASVAALFIWYQLRPALLVKR